MPETPSASSTVRADARRNRANLVAAAAAAYARGGDRVSLNAIAREAGVGPGTLYRHFPTREDLVEAVYRDEIERLRASAESLLASHPPDAALRLWVRRFADWAITKHGMIDALGAIIASGRITGGQMRGELVDMVARFLEAGAETGTLRADATADDVAAMLAGALTVAGRPDQRDQLGRMLDLVADGLRPA